MAETVQSDSGCSRLRKIRLWGYSRSCFQIRNEWMVNHSARVIAVFNSEKSGTKKTIDYAVKVDVPVARIGG